MDSVHAVTEKLNKYGSRNVTTRSLASISHTSLERICQGQSKGLNSVVSLCGFPIENSSYMGVIEQYLALSLSEQPKSAALSGYSFPDFLPPGENCLNGMFSK